MIFGGEKGPLNLLGPLNVWLGRHGCCDVCRVYAQFIFSVSSSVSYFQFVVSILHVQFFGHDFLVSTQSHQLQNNTALPIDHFWSELGDDTDQMRSILAVVTVPHALQHFQFRSQSYLFF